MNSFVAVRALRTAINNGHALTWFSTTSMNVQKSSGGSTPKSPSPGAATPKSPSPGAATAKSPTGIDVTSKNLDPPAGIFKPVDSKEVGPGASKTGKYPNPEYYSYHKMSYAEMEIVMADQRCPQPTSKKTAK